MPVEENSTFFREKFNTLIADNATINKVDTWGQRTLAYPINDETVGHYENTAKQIPRSAAMQRCR